MIRADTKAFGLDVSFLAVLILLMQKALLLLFLLIILIPQQALSYIYKYVSEDGTLFYTNRPKKTPNNPDPTVKKAFPHKISLSKSTRSERSNTEDYSLIAEQKAKQYNLDPKLIKAVIKVESNWNPLAVSPKGAMGLMQLVPSTAALMGVQNPFDPIENLDGGVRYLKHLIERFNGNLVLALAAYNAGPKLVEAKNAVPSIPETIDYVKRVMNYYTGNSSYQLYTSIEKELVREITRIKRIVQEDGTILFTNSHIY